MTQIFDEGLESGDFSNFDGQNIDGLNSVAIAQDIVHRGRYSAKVLGYSDGITPTYAGYYKEFSEVTEVFHRFYSYVDSIEGVVGKNATLSSIWGTSGIGWIVIRKAFPSLWQLGLYYWADGEVKPAKWSTQEFPLKRWFCLEIQLAVHATNGLIRVYYEGNELTGITTTGLNTTGRGNIVRIYNGVRSIYFDSIIYYFDSIKIADAYIGVNGAKYLPALKCMPHAAL